MTKLLRILLWNQELQRELRRLLRFRKVALATLLFTIRHITPFTYLQDNKNKMVDLPQLETFRMTYGNCALVQDYMNAF